jgi:hypothetical protein
VTSFIDRHLGSVVPFRLRAWRVSYELS